MSSEKENVMDMKSINYRGPAIEEVDSISPTNNAGLIDGSFSGSPYSSDSRSSGSSTIEPVSDSTYHAKIGKPIYKRIVDSFKPMDLEDLGIDTEGMTQLEKSVIATSQSRLVRDLKTYHLIAISLGGSIGTGLFVGSGNALAYGGPASMVIGYFIVCCALLTVINALGELSVQFPINGSFNTFFSRFIDPSWGFTLAIMYYLSWAISYPSELIAAAMTIQYWNTSINSAVWVAIVWVVVSSINFFGVKGYGDVEFVLTIIKVVAVVGFLIVGICITCGVGDQGYIGGKYWHDPGAFNHGFKGVCSVFISAAFSMGGLELCALAAAETKNPRKALPKAVKQTFWRLTIFYFLTSIVIGCLVPYTNPNLLDGSGIAASPFVIAINAGGIKVLPHIMNAVIIAAVISVGNSSVFGASRTLAALAAQGMIPKIFGYIDRKGRPLVAIVITSLIGLLGFLVVNKNEEAVFTWFFAVCSLASFFIWSMINVTHLRWRWALDAQGRSKDEIIFRSPFGVVGSFAGLAVLIFIIATEIWVSLYPIGSTGASVETFWQDCLSLPLLLAIWAAHKTYYRTWNRLWVKLEDIDLDSGRREISLEDLKQELADEREALHSKPFYYRVYHFFC
ncbi:uncharacterized protein LODBEIA_P02440 [Lodderomyces beijingensis]|uniref:Amino acid permease/ SLC12A domain-containing protein n=1 Tax=Lodderomyces beijingensis TaxID=1775926 RepID=A0ABP0ZFR5_9ASCO